MSHHTVTNASPTVKSRLTLVGAGLVAAVIITTMFIGLGRDVDQPATPVARTAEATRPLLDGQPVVAGDGRLYYFRGYHQPGTYEKRHPLVSATRTGRPVIAPGLSVAPVG